MRFAILARSTLDRRVVRRRDPGGAAERVDNQTRVVGDRRAARRPGRVARLGEGVLDERGVRLVGLADCECALRDQVDAERREQRQLGELAGLLPRTSLTPRPATARQSAALRRDQLADAFAGEDEQASIRRARTSPSAVACSSTKRRPRS
jgi:hypothetical protein